MGQYMRDDVIKMMAESSYYDERFINKELKNISSLLNRCDNLLKLIEEQQKTYEANASILTDEDHALFAKRINILMEALTSFIIFKQEKMNKLKKDCNTILKAKYEIKKEERQKEIDAAPREHIKGSFLDFFNR